MAASLLLAGCGGSSLESDDPAGYKACQLHAESLKITDDPLMAMGAMFDVGEQASEARTRDIRDAASQIGDTWIVDSDALQDACRAAGVGDS